MFMLTNWKHKFVLQVIKLASFFTFTLDLIFKILGFIFKIFNIVLLLLVRVVTDLCLKFKKEAKKKKKGRMKTKKSYLIKKEQKQRKKIT